MVFYRITAILIIAFAVGCRAKEPAAKEKTYAMTATIVSRDAAQKHVKRPIVTEIVPAQEFWAAEDYHQDYYANNKSQPYCQMIISPKLDKFRKHYPERVKTP